MNSIEFFPGFKIALYLNRGYWLVVRIGRPFKMINKTKTTITCTITTITVIDEIQDYMPIHIRIIQECLPSNCSMTLIGDVYQNLESELGFDNWSDVENIFYLKNSLKNLSECHYFQFAAGKYRS